MSGFCQLIQFQTDDIEPILALTAQWADETEHRRTATRAITYRDHADGNQYTTVVLFPSYAAAQQNNALPETAAFAEQMQKQAMAVEYTNLDLVDDSRWPATANV